MYGDVKVEIREPRKSGDLSEECELNWVSGREARVSPISPAVVWSETSDGIHGKGSHAMPVVKQPYRGITGGRPVRRGVGKMIGTTNTIVDRT